MPRLTTLAILLTTAILCGSIFAANTQPTIQSLNKMPLSFTKNMGQWDDRVLFRANAGSATMWFTKEGVTYQFTRRIGGNTPPVGPLSRGDLKSTSASAARNEDIPLLRGVRGVSDRDSIEQLVLTAKFVGANPNPEIVAEGQMEYKCNYFIGNDQAKWHTDVPNYEAITLKDIYPGIDLKYSSDGTGQAAYEFIAAPGADMAKIKVAYEGAEETSLDSDGKLILKTKWGDMTAAIGSSVNGTGLASPKFTLKSENTLGLAAGSRSLAETTSGTLTLSYSTFLGTCEDDWGMDIAVDGSGNAYVTGYTRSDIFPLQNPYQTNQEGGFYGHNAFVTKFGGLGNTLIYSTYLGGGDDDVAGGIAVDSNGSAYVTGCTNSSDFPTVNPYQTYKGSVDIFVTKLNSAGDGLVFSTYLGGTGADGEISYGYCREGIAIDAYGNAYIAGGTHSADFPTKNPFQTYQGWTDAFVTKVSSSGSSLVYSTYLGGKNGDDRARSVAVDGSGCAYVTGRTNTASFPTLNPIQPYQGGNTGYDAFVTKLSSSGSSLLYSTYLGGAGNDDGGQAIAVDGQGSAYVTGYTRSSDFPTQNPFQAAHDGGEADAFVVKLSSSGDKLMYGSYLGGSNWDVGYDIAVDGSGSAYVTGEAWSPDFPILNYYQGPHPGYYGSSPDAFVTKVDPTGTKLLYSTCLGGSNDDCAYGIAIDGRGCAYVAGETHSEDFPVFNAYQATWGGFSDDAFVTKLNWAPDYLCGDVNSDGRIDLRDLVFLRNYVVFGGPAPQSLSSADVNCSGGIDISDVMLLKNYYFDCGPAPCAECE
jgi:hypothetical protein